MLQWFRKKLSAAEAAAPEVPVRAAPIEEAPELAEVAPAAEEERTKRRRRGTRGGRGRRKTAAPAVPAAEGPAQEELKSDGAPKQARRRRQPSRRSGSAAARRGRPAARKEIVVSVDVAEQRVAVLEDGKAVEVYLERPGRRSIAGNVYKGVVDNVLPGMEASFVDIGLDRNGFLYVDEIVVPELEGKRHGRRIQDLIQRGEEVLVQAVKDPMRTKGARVTTDISLPGRFLVYTPFGEGIGVSRRLDDAERDRLKAITKELDLPEGGIIVRTAAEGASREELEGDLALLRKLWSTLQGRAARTKPPALVYQEAELPLRIIRDLFIRDFERVLVDHERTHRRIVGYLKRTSKELAERVELYSGKEPIMEKHGVDAAIRSTLDRRVDLPSGGYLVFDYAEAFTIVDVNTGRFVGARGKTSGARLEDTITKNNLEAVEEVVRQLRLRDVGGIIVIDFIDMANPKNRELVEEALRHELEKDRTKTYVVEISPLGLVEMTRQNVTDGPREILTHACPTCDGDGVVVSDETHAVNAERELRRLAAASRNQAFRIELNSRIAALLIGSGASRVAELERETGRRFYVEARDDVPPDHVVLLERGPISRLEGKRLPVAAGDELELRLEGEDAQMSGDAVARLDGYAVSVASARKRIGQTVKVRIERATTTAAYAVLANGDAAEPPVEAGLEVEREESEGEREEPKRRSRRGSRGGRGRKKQAVASEASVTVEPEALAEPEAVAEAEPAEATREDGSADEPPRKRTRRGSRGGRNRRRKRAAVDTEAAGESAPQPDAVAVVAGEEERG
ncbi:MAG: Rne/Rng family ribonuclease [Thermoleophilia bacterium]|nr:Rne/Rng family ribonuclease [Thermoleophilia bacterium]MDQ3857047.1 Rne/Rng family ribonuclease [Actinomycetota bacterium]